MNLTSDVVIRPLASADWQTLRLLRLAALADSAGAFLGDPVKESAWSAGAWRQCLGQKSWYAAYRDQSRAGLASVVYYPPAGSHYVESMWVSPEHRRRGVAPALLAAIEQQVRDQGGSVLRLWVLSRNPSAAAIYRHYGFRPTGVEQEPLGYPGIIEIEFIRDLPSPSSATVAQRTIRGTTDVTPSVATESATGRRISIRTP